MNGTTDALHFDSRFDLNVDGSVESESGLGVSARFRIRNEDTGGATISAPRIDLTFGAATLSVGNTDSAIRARSNPWGSCVGNLGDFCGGSVVGGGFSSTDGADADRVRLDYAAGDFVVSASTSLGDDAEDIEVGVSGAMSGVNANVGFKMDGDTAAAYALDLNGTFGTVNGGIRYDKAAAADAVATLYGSTTMGATTAGIYLTNADGNKWGLGVSHDLGGGVAIGGAIADSDLAQAHVSFSF